MENMNSNPAAPAPIDFYKPRDEGINGLGGFYRIDDQLNNALDALISARSGGMERADSAHSAFPRYSLSAMLGRGALFVSYDNEHMNAISRRAFSDGIRFFVHRDLIDELNVANLDASNKITDSLAREWMADALLLGACNVMGVDWIDGVPRLGFATRLSYPDSAPPVVPEHLSARNSITWIDPSLLRDIMINAYGASSSLLAIDESIGKTDVVSNQAMVKAACQDYSEASQMALLSFERFANAQSGKLSSQTASASGFGKHLLEINNSISNLLISAQNCEHMFVGTTKDEIDNRAFFLSPQDHLTLFGKVKTWASTRDNAILTDISDVGHLGIRTSLMLSLKREAAIAGWDLTQEDLERITNTFSASPNISRKEIEILIDALSGYDELRPAKPLDVHERACAAGIAGKSRLGLFGKDFDQALKLIAKPAHFHSQIMAASGGSLYPSHTAPNLLDQCREVASGRRPWVDDLVAYAPTEVMREALTKMDTHPALTQEHVVAACAHYNAIEHVNALVEFHAGKNDHTRPLDKFDPNPIIEALLSHVPARKEAQLHDLLVNLQDHGLDLGAFDAHAIQLPQDAHAKVAPDLATVLRAKASWEARSMDRRVSQSPSRPRSRL